MGTECREILFWGWGLKEGTGLPLPEKHEAPSGPWSLKEQKFQTLRSQCGGRGGAEVQSLVRELRSHMWRGVTKLIMIK